MRIEGLRIGSAGRTDAAFTTEFHPRERGLRPGRIRLTIHPDADAVVEFLDSSGRRPGLEESEAVAINSFDEFVGDRIVRALASLHLGVEEAETGYTATDVTMIEAGYRIGRLPEGAPAWIRMREGWAEIVAKQDGSGLPATPDDPALAMLVAPGGRTVTCAVDDLRSAIHVIDADILRQAHDPWADIQIDATSLAPPNLLKH